ncbi:hypothetical protein CC80DRAFT_567649, partial [Byssothecium circinans]
SIPTAQQQVHSHVSDTRITHNINYYYTYPSLQNTLHPTMPPPPSSPTTCPFTLSDSIKQAIIWATVIVVIALGIIARCVRRDMAKIKERRNEHLHQERLHADYVRRNSRLNEAPPPYANDYATVAWRERDRGEAGQEEVIGLPAYPVIARVQ